jgi:hypothetical protein
MRYATDAYEAARGTLSAQDIIRYAQVRKRAGRRVSRRQRLWPPVSVVHLSVCAARCCVDSALQLTIAVHVAPAPAPARANRFPQYRTYLKGSSTVCLALMKPHKQLEIANVGDSGVRILRNGRVIFGTEVRGMRRGAGHRRRRAGVGCLHSWSASRCAWV